MAVEASKKDLDKVFHATKQKAQNAEAASPNTRAKQAAEVIARSHTAPAVTDEEKAERRELALAMHRVRDQ